MAELEPNNPTPLAPKKSQPFLIAMIIILVVIILVLVGAILYFYTGLFQKATSTNKNENAIVNQNVNSAVVANQNTNTAVVNVNQNTNVLINTNASATADNEFNPSTVKVGDKVGALTVVSVDRFSAKMLNRNSDFLFNNDISIGFSGSVSVSGYYSYDESDMIPGLIAFDVTDQVSKDKLPRMSGEETHDLVWFIILNKDEAEKLLGIESKDATIVIDNYTFNRYPSEVTDTANIVSVVE